MESYRHSLAARGILTKRRRSFVLVPSPTIIEPGKVGIKNVLELEGMSPKADVFFPNEQDNKDILKMPEVKEQLGGELSELGLEPMYAFNITDFKREYMENYRANMTPEQKEELRAKQNE
jgi:hypothetical protein